MHEPIGVVNQTTFNTEVIERILEALRARYENVRYIPTMCDDILQKQAELRERGRAFDTVLVIGDRKSANSTHLAEIAEKELHKPTLFLLTEAELLPEHLNGMRHVFVAAGASSPQSSIEGVMNKLGTFGFVRDDAWDVHKSQSQ